MAESYGKAAQQLLKAMDAMFAETTRQGKTWSQQIQYDIQSAAVVDQRTNVVRDATARMIEQAHVSLGKRSSCDEENTTED